MCLQVRNKMLLTFPPSKVMKEGYEAKPDDILNEWVENTPQVRRVIRLVTSTF
jgi:hypothetical protein